MVLTAADVARAAGESAAVVALAAIAGLLIARLEARARARRELQDRQRHWR